MAHMAAEINKRGRELRKNYIDDTEEESPWDDDDDDDF